VIAVRDVDQLRRDAQPVPRLAHAPLEHGADAELLADPADVEVLSLECECRRPRRHAQRLDLRERVEDLLGHSLAEVFLVSLWAHVGERKHRDRLRCRVHPGSAGHCPGRCRRSRGLQRLRELIGRPEALTGLLGQRFRHRGVEPLGEVAATVAQRRRRIGEQLRDNGLRRRAREGDLAGEHFVEHRPQ